MYRLTLEWAEGDRSCSQVISAEQVAKSPLRIGRDETQCDMVLRDTTKTVSRLHVDIFFNNSTNTFYLRNLTRDQPPEQRNPAVVDGQKIIKQEVPLKTGSLIQLGKMALKVKAIEGHQIQPQHTPPQPVEYGLKCPNNHILDYKYLGFFCPHCGETVSAGETVVLPASGRS